MDDYEQTLKDIKETFGLVPGFMKAIPKDVLIHDWPLMKKYQLGESEIQLNIGNSLGWQWQLISNAPTALSCTQQWLQ